VHTIHVRVCLTGAPVLDDVRRCEPRAHDPDHGHRLHQACRCCDYSPRTGFGLIYVLSCMALVTNSIEKVVCIILYADTEGYTLHFGKNLTTLMFDHVSSFPRSQKYTGITGRNTTRDLSNKVISLFKIYQSKLINYTKYRSI
jgi:hypothetical protein